MNAELQISEIQAIQSELEAINLEITATQSISQLIDLGGKLAAWVALSGDQMAIAKRIWRKETVKAYDSHVFSKMASGMAIHASIANKYASARAGDYEANWDLCDRVNKTCVHILDFLRTVISALKEENKIYNNNTIPT
jgi:hypothetical protein